LSTSKFRCIHISDVHFRGLSRHDEYRESFAKFFKIAKKLDPNVIFVGGDIVHSKTQGISPELIDILSWWFRGLASIAPTHVILGNHDGLISNSRRQDAISPIISALNNENIHLHKYSGVYDTGVDGFKWNVFSCFDNDWGKVKPDPNCVNIACYHGSVRGSTTDSDWALESDVPLEFFDDYDFVFLGDIHKFQYLNKKKTIAYPGSSIQQDYGERINKGFIYWEIDDSENYKSKFIKIPHKNQFVTIDWAGNVSETLALAEKYPEKSRFRIRSQNNISPAAWEQLVGGLKESRQALEIVEKSESPLGNTPGEFKKIDNQNLRDLRVLQEILTEFGENQSLDQDDLASLRDMTSEIFSQIPAPDSIRNVYWKLRKLEFSNTFAYGEDNIIDFDKLRGIIGIFGRNAIGKSSIPGTIMYSLFNTTDRGPMKNLHIINMRKNYCLTKANIQVGGKDYLVERQSVRHKRRDGTQHATTDLNLYEIDSAGKLIDHAGEQRRDTEKELRNLIGVADDFLLTAFASQGEMNNFLKKKATARKLTLTNFLDLKIFEEMNKVANDKKLALKGEMQSAPKRDWDTILSEKESERYKFKKNKTDSENELVEVNREVADIEFNLRKSNSTNIVTQSDVDDKVKEIKLLNDNFTTLQKQSDKFLKDWREQKEAIEKYRGVLEKIDIKELEESLSAQDSLERTLQLMVFELKQKRDELERKKSTIAKLSEVPCGDKFPMCKYIIDAHTAKTEYPDLLGTIEDLKNRVEATQESVDKLIGKKIREKIEKYNEVNKKCQRMQVDLDRLKNERTIIFKKQELITDQIAHENEKLNKLKSMVTNSDVTDQVLRLKERHNELRSRVRELDATRMSAVNMIGRLDLEILQLQEQRGKFDELHKKWNILQVFLQATSKKGIPLSILMKELPKVNDEIKNILRGVINFTVELEADPLSNAMDVYINYGDSRRIIECASGMEKMMASLAIRVALMNVSCLPKPDILIIDEGFGTLDEINVEACNRLLKSLKKFFKTIMVISHIDAVKDSVDYIIEINKSGKDANIIERRGE
jgi:DNA repair exonuclease SbcCD ATPase subunit